MAMNAMWRGNASKIIWNSFTLQKNVNSSPHKNTLTENAQQIQRQELKIIFYFYQKKKKQRNIFSFSLVCNMAREALHIAHTCAI